MFVEILCMSVCSRNTTVSSNVFNRCTNERSSATSRGGTLTARKRNRLNVALYSELVRERFFESLIEQ